MRLVNIKLKGVESAYIRCMKKSKNLLKAMEHRISLMLDCAHKVASSNGCPLTKDEFLILVRDECRIEVERENKEYECA